jgi:hypothetical protein
MPDNYRLARKEEMRLNVERTQRAREAEADALFREFNARLSAGRAVWSQQATA